MFSSSERKAVAFLLLICLLKQVCSLLYDELPTLGESCDPEDSCHSSSSQPDEEDDREKKTCECDATCKRRGTCCIDSPYVDPTPSTRKEICDVQHTIGVGNYYYFNYTGKGDIYKVKTCDSRWKGPSQVRELCEMENPVDGVDFMVAIPVTNINSGFSYKNYFCALCNNDIQNSVLWDVSIHKNDENSWSHVSDKFDIQSLVATDDESPDTAGGSSQCNGSSTVPLVFNKEKGYYGYWDYCSSEIPKFVTVGVTLSIPEQVHPVVKGCRLSLISTCAPGWTDVTTRTKCEAYMGIIKGPETRENGFYRRDYYRNVHCALCNYVTDFDDYSCEPFSVGAIIITPTFPTSLTILFGHLLSNNGCLSDSEKYVKGLGCRAVLCTNPQHKVKNGKCVP